MDFNQNLLAELNVLYRTARYLLGDSALAEDIVQEVVIKAIQGQDTFQSGADFRPWVFSILRNTITDHHRKQRTQPYTVSLDDNDLDIPGDTTVEKDVLEQVLDEEITLALAELPEDMRLAVLLADIEEFSYEEIAKVLNWPIGTVMSRLYRGRQKLRFALHRFAERKGYLI